MSERAIVVGCPALESLGPNKWDRCRDNAEFLAAAKESAQHKGIIGQSILLLGTVPTNTNTVVIGAETYTFKTVPAAAKDVLIGASALLSIANLVAKITSETALLIKATAITGGMKLQFATAAGVPVIGVPTSYALSETLADAADIWDQANLNATGQDNYLYQSRIQIVGTTENIATAFSLPLAFTPLMVTFRIVDAAFLPVAACSATIVINGDVIDCDFAAGATDLNVGEIVLIEAYGSELV